MDEDNQRIPNPAYAELAADGRLLYQIEHRKPSDVNRTELAGMISSLRALTVDLEQHLDRPAKEILDEANIRTQVEDHDDPSNVE